MTPPVVPSVPALSRVPNVELCQTGTWQISSGTATFTTDDFRSAVAALECPAVRRPALKLGHRPPFGQGEAAIGYIDNLRGSDDWRTLVGDYAGMPGWFATPDEHGQTVLASAFPDRSIEGAWDWRCQMGHTHPFVILAVALLGAELPGVGTLASLQDVGTLYGVDGTPEIVAASAAQADTDEAVVVDVRGAGMPNPRPRRVAASVTTDDVRRAFYGSPVGAGWDVWIEEVQLDPLQIIYVDDAEGARYRVPVTITGTDGADAVEFGNPVPVLIRYEDAPTGAAAAAGPGIIRYANRAESRPDHATAGTPTAPETPADQQVQPTPEEDGDMPDIPSWLPERLGVAADADEATIQAALDEALAERADPPAATPPVPAGSVILPAVEVEELRSAAAAGALARRRQLEEDREQAIAGAIRTGRIAPERAAHWRESFDVDYEGALASIQRLPEGLIPVAAAGYAGGGDKEDVDPAAGDDYWFPGATKRVAAGTAGD